MVVLNVTYFCKEGKRDDFLKALLEEGLDKKCQADPGNITYDYYLPAVEDNTLLLVEKWENKELMMQHGKTPHMARIGELKAEYVERTQLEILLPEEK